MTDPAETAPRAERALLVRPLAQQQGEAGPSEIARLQEARGLAEALDLDVAHAWVTPLRRISSATYFGSGKVAEIGELAQGSGASVLIVDTALSPVQQRNLERALKIKVIDRTGLILEIFARRARTREGRLQVELARLRYERSRLVRTWTHLERQRGGLGKTGGPGETQLELDRRRLAQRIDRMQAELEGVRRVRATQRASRKRAGLPTVAFVGYTNAGKSSLFNRLTAAGVLAKDMPFATLDPTARLVRLPSGRELILSDTVGFITDLPVELVAAFRATLEEVSEADVLVHVRDIASPEAEAQKGDVLSVLAALNAGPEFGQPIVEAWNKIDQLDPEDRATRGARAARDPEAAAISAITGEGVEELLEKIDRAAFGALRLIPLVIDPADGRLRAAIAAQGRILEETLTGEGRLSILAELPVLAAARFEALVRPRAAE